MNNPNIYYYIDKPIFYNMTPEATVFGQRNALCCGGNWILGADFAINLDFFTNTYQMGIICEVTSLMDNWYGLREHLLQVESVLHTTKTYIDVLNELGLG